MDRICVVCKTVCLFACVLCLIRTVFLGPHMVMLFACDNGHSANEFAHRHYVITGIMMMTQVLIVIIMM